MLRTCYFSAPPHHAPCYPDHRGSLSIDYQLFTCIACLPRHAGYRANTLAVNLIYVTRLVNPLAIYLPSPFLYRLCLHIIHSELGESKDRRIDVSYIPATKSTNTAFPVLSKHIFTFQSTKQPFLVLSKPCQQAPQPKSTPFGSSNLAPQLSPRAALPALCSSVIDSPMWNLVEQFVLFL